MTTTTSPARQLIEAGMIELTLQVSLDGRTWYPQVFDGESSSYVDTLASIFVAECGPNLEVAFDQETNWSMFPKTFEAMVDLTVDRIEPVAVPA